MRPNKELITGFSEIESKRIKKHLLRLVPHLTPNKFVIVGGLAIRYHLLIAGISYPPRPFNDLDIIAESVNVVNPDIKNDFLIYHFNQKGDFFFFAFVDKVTKTKVDIFNYTNLPDTIEVPFNSHGILIASVEDQLAKTVYDIQRISEETKVDPKQFLDARLLFQIANLPKADVLWKQRQNPEQPETIVNALQKAESLKQNHPEWIQKSPFRKSHPYHCKNCIRSKKFPLDSMEEIYKALGYVE